MIKEDGRNVGLDLTRTIGTYLVMLVHIQMTFMSISNENYQTRRKLSEILHFFFQFGMPAFFYISGFFSGKNLQKKHIYWDPPPPMHP